MEGEIGVSRVDWCWPQGRGILYFMLVDGS